MTTHGNCEWRRVALVALLLLVMLSATTMTEAKHHRKVAGHNMFGAGKHKLGGRAFAGVGAGAGAGGIVDDVTNKLASLLTSAISPVTSAINTVKSDLTAWGAKLEKVGQSIALMVPAPLFKLADDASEFFQTLKRIITQFPSDKPATCTLHPFLLSMQQYTNKLMSQTFQNEFCIVNELFKLRRISFLGTTLSKISVPQPKQSSFIEIGSEGMVSSTSAAAGPVSNLLNVTRLVGKLNLDQMDCNTLGSFAEVLATVKDVIDIYIETCTGVVEIVELEVTEGIAVVVRLVLMLVAMFLRVMVGLFKTLCIAVGFNTA